MLFEAETNGIKYEVTVSENRTHWKICLCPEDQEPISYDFSKEDYQYVNDTISFLFKGSSYLVDVVDEGLEQTVYTRGSFRTVKIFNDEMLLHESLRSGSSSLDENNLSAGMPGKIVKIMVEEGDTVQAGDALLIMEAMKMENEMRASKTVTIDKITVSPGDTVEGGQLLISYIQEK